MNLALEEDCMVVMPRYPDKYFDLAVCDIPWGVNIAAKKSMGRSKKERRHSKNGSKATMRRLEDYTIKDWDKAPPDYTYFEELCRVSKHQIIFGIDYVDWNVGPGRIKWDKGVAEGMSFSRYENAYCSLIDYELELPLLWAGMLQAKSLKEPMTAVGNKKLNEKRIHPCHKPVLLYDAIYNRFGFEGMKVIDTHLGGGSNRISCFKLGYDFVGCEIDKEYFTKQENRFQLFTKQIKIW